MKFNATYLVKTDEERASLEKSLEFLGEHTEFTAIGRDSLDVFCAYTSRNSIDERRTIIVAPMREELRGIRHVLSYHTNNKGMSVSHGHSEYYRISLSSLGIQNVDFDIYYEPIKDFGKFFPQGEEDGDEEEKESSEEFGSGAGLLDLTLEAEGGQDDI